MNSWTRGTLFVVAIFVVAGCSNKDQSQSQSVTGMSREDELIRASAPDDFDKGAEVQPNFQTRLAAARLLEAQGNLPGAAMQYDEALKLERDNVEALYRLGILRTTMKQYELAIDAWQRYTKATQKSPVGYGNLGFCYELANQPEQAEQTYRKGVQRDPANQFVRVNFGLMLARLDRIDEAQEQLGAVLPPAAVFYNIASVYEQRGMTEQAREWYRKSLQSDSNFRDAKARLAAID